jgi:hypothetical protein
MCRKAHGAAFVTFVEARADAFRWVKGEDLVTFYRSSSAFQRSFCRVCGSNLPILEPGEIYAPAGALDDDPGIRPQTHIFVGSKAPWVEILDELPRFDEYPPEMAPNA